MRRMLILMVLAALCTVPCFGAEEAAVPGLEEFWDQAEDYGVTGDGDLGRGLSGLLEEGLNQLSSLSGGAVATGLKLLAVVLLCALADGAGMDGKKEGIQVVELTGALAITAMSVMVRAGIPSGKWTPLGRCCFR